MQANDMVTVKHYNRMLCSLLTADEHNCHYLKSHKGHYLK